MWPRLPKTLAARVTLGIVLGTLAGALAPSWAPACKVVSDIFVRLVRMTIPPLVFITLVTGIAGMGNLAQVGLLGLRALVLFQALNVLGLALGIGMATWMQPGAGMVPPSSVNSVDLERAAHTNWGEFLVGMVPESGIGALAEGNMLAVLVFALFFGAAMARLPEKTAHLRLTLVRVGDVLFTMMDLVMQLSPFAAFAAMAYSVGAFGLETLRSLAQMALAVYAATALFVVVVLGGLARVYQFSLRRLVLHLKDELLLVLGTSSSQSALPQLIAKLQQAGCSQAVAGLVIPTGYSFNLVGTAIYLAVATIFIAQVYGAAMTPQQLLAVLGVLVLTSKAASGVQGSGFVTLATTLVALPQLHIPAEGIALVLGVDRFLSPARSVGNILANVVAAVVLAKKADAFVSTNIIDDEGHQTTTAA